MGIEKKILAEIERFLPDKHVNVPVLHGKRLKVLLLCLNPGVNFPSHQHRGYEVTLQMIRGRLLLPSGHGEEITLSPGEFYLVDGEHDFALRNPFTEPAEILVHLVKLLP